MSAPRISVVIPAYDAQPWIEGAIGSAKEQVPEPFEVIVVDDGSTDGTAARAQASGARVIRQPNRGPAAARNAGARVASGDALLFLDADDSLLPGALERLLAAAEAHPGWTAIVPNYVRAGSASGTAWPSVPETEVLDRTSVGAMLVANRLSPNALVRREAWRRTPFREDLRTAAAEDLDLWLRLLLADGRVIRLGQPLVRKRVGRPGSASVDLRAMRAGRREVFVHLWRRGDLAPRERALLAYQIARSTVGTWLARRPSRARHDAAGVVQVYLDDPGGGPRHVALLRRALDRRIAFREVAVPSSAGRGLPGLVAGARRLARAVGSERWLVHAHGVRAAAAALPVVVFRRLPLVITIHGLHSLRRSNSAAIRSMNRLVVRRAAVVMVLGDSDRALVGSAGLAPPERVRTIHPAVEPRRVPDGAAARRALGLDPDAVVVLWLGRLSPEKDPLTFVEALGRATDPSVVGLIAGDGHSALEVAEAVRTRGFGSRVRLLGWLEDPGVAIGAADAFVSTSRWEGVSIAALEAGAAGLPLVLTDVPGNRDLVSSGVPAVMVPVGEPEPLAAALDRLAADVADRRRRGDETRKVVLSSFTVQALADDVLAVYEEVLGGGRPGSSRPAAAR